jgi:hypothetical protein
MLASIVDARTLFLVACTSAFALATSREVRAMGAVVGSPADAAEITRVRVAVASSGARTSRWVSLHVHGQAGPFAWVVPVGPGTMLDFASDAWLQSLEDATAPRVVPPATPPPPSCSVADGVDVVGDASHGATTRPDAIALASDATGLSSTLAAWGFELPGSLGALVDAGAAQGDRVLALRFAGGAADVDTRTLRLVDEGPASLRFSWTQSTSPLDVTAYAFTTGSAAFGSNPPLRLDPSRILWSASGGSSYAESSGALLAQAPGAWLVDTAGHTPLFDGEAVPGATSVPALALAYFTGAAAYGDAAGVPSGCAQQASSWEASLSPVGIACPGGALGSGDSGDAGTPCQETTAPGDIPADAFRCGGIADDLALALSGLAPGGTWLSRARSAVAPAAFGSDVLVAASAAAAVASVGPVIACSGYEGPCGVGGAGAVDGGEPAPGPAHGGSGSAGGGSPSTGPAFGGAAGAAEAAGAGGATYDDSGGGGCDASGLSDSCASSGSDSTGSDDSSSSNDSCSSQSSGSSDDSSSNDCSIRRGGGARKGRSPTSRVVLFVAAFALAARRRARHRR